MNPTDGLQACPACGGRPGTAVLRVPLPDHAPLRFVACSRCGAWAQASFFDSAEERRFYDAYAGLTYDPPAWEVAFLHERLRRIERHVPGRGRLLDIGCGRGHLVAAACRRGWDAFGIEASALARSSVLPEVAGRIRVGTLEEAAGGRAEFDVVTMYHVLEHLREPAKALCLAAGMLKAGGVLVVATPDAGSLVARILGRRWAAFRMRDHCVLYTAGALARVMAAAGCRVRRMGRGGQPFACAGSAGPAGTAAGVLRRRGLRFLGASRALRRCARAVLSGLALGDALETYAIRTLRGGGRAGATRP